MSKTYQFSKKLTIQQVKNNFLNISIKINIFFNKYQFYISVH